MAGDQSPELDPAASGDEYDPYEAGDEPDEDGRYVDGYVIVVDHPDQAPGTAPGDGAARIERESP